MMKKFVRRMHIRGFTLVELMVVVVIVGMMATVVTISVSDYLVKAKQSVAKSDIATIKNALSLFYMEHDRYPTTDEGLAILKKKTAKNPNGIVQNELKDPWRHDYVYIFPGVHGSFDVVSFGADGQEGGEGADADITSWNLEGSEK